MSNFIVAKTPTSFEFMQFVSNFILVGLAHEIRKLLFLLGRLCQTLLFVHITKRYRVKDKAFVLVFVRSRQGSYIVSSIDDRSTTPTSATSATKSLLTSAKAFEATRFYKKNLPSKDSWPLNTGGMNHSYLFDDTENLGAHISVSITETKSSPSDVSVIWYGKSTKAPARMTKTKEAFLRDVLSVAAPSVNPKQVFAYIRKVGSRSYPGGSTAMPRTTIAGMSMHAGTAGESLIVGIER